MAAPSSSTPPNLDQGWSPEPELREPAPRRLAAVDDFPDLNKPNALLFTGAGGAQLALGLLLFILGLAQHKVAFTGFGLVLALAGAALLVVYPMKLRSHEERARNLVENGLPMMANVLTSDNLTGDSTYGRTVKYQVALPGGEVVNRSVNADERRLPKMIPGKATALIDMSSNDVELYCALPVRALARPSAAPAAAPSPAPVGVPVTAAPVPAGADDPFATIPQAASAGSGGASSGGRMGTLGTIGASATTPAPSRPAPPPPAPEPEPEAPAAAPPQPAPADDKLPWE